MTGNLRGWGKELLHRLEKRIRFSNVENRNPILVHQMGKVGSRTVVRTLEDLDLGSPVIHVHNLNPETVMENVRSLRSNPGYLHEHVISSRLLVRKRLNWGEFPCRVITLTREPVGRAISFVFEDWNRQMPDASTLEEVGSERITQLIEEKLQSGTRHADPGRWFDEELREVFGIDVMSVPYDFERGYLRIRSGPVEVLVIRMEDLDRALPGALGALFGIDPESVQVRRANVGTSKAYGDRLTEMKRRFGVPRERVREILNTRYARHFYGPDLHRLRTKWEKTGQSTT